MSYFEIPRRYHSRWNKTRDSLYEKLSNKRVLAALTVLPVVILFAIINVIPILWAIAAGFFDIFIFDPVWEFVGLGNYRELAGDAAFHISLIRSATFAVGAVSFQLVVGILLAVLVTREFRFNKFSRAIVMMPYLIPTAIVAYQFHWMMNSSYGIVNWVLINLGILDSTIAWFGGASTAMISVIGVNWWKYTSFVAIMTIARLQSIPESHYEAARVCGANWWRQFWDITLPNLKGVIFIVLLLRGVWMFLHFDSIWILTRGGPGDATMVSAVYAYDMAFRGFELGYAAAISTVLFVILVITAVIYFVVLEPEEEVRVE